MTNTNENSLQERQYNTSYQKNKEMKWINEKQQLIRILRNKDEIVIVIHNGLEKLNARGEYQDQKKKNPSALLKGIAGFMTINKLTLVTCAELKEIRSET